MESTVLAEGRYDRVFLSVRVCDLVMEEGTDAKDRLLLEYARVMSLDREAMDYVG